MARLLLSITLCLLSFEWALSVEAPDPDSSDGPEVRFGTSHVQHKEAQWEKTDGTWEEEVELVPRNYWRWPAAVHDKKVCATLFGINNASRLLRCHGRNVRRLGDDWSEKLANERGRAKDYELLAPV